MLPIQAQYFSNTLFNRDYLYTDLPKIFDNILSKPVFEEIKKIYDKDKFSALSEAQLEEEFVKLVLTALGYAFAYQTSKKAFGKSHKPDFALFADNQRKDDHYKEEKDSNKDILALCESKKYDIMLDNNKIDESNPHFQLLRYLNDLKIAYGFLTNGRSWRFYDTKENRANKIFFEVDLEKIIENNDLEGFNYFYFIFRKEAFAPTATTKEAATIQGILQNNIQVKADFEQDLKNVVYGADSIVEQIGQALFTQILQTEGMHTSIHNTLGHIYQNSVTLAFRLIFIAYFEDKFEYTLFEVHKFYKQYSLKQFFSDIKDKNNYTDEDFNGWGELKRIFLILDAGESNFDLPLLNGGLFSPEKALLLQKDRILNNKTLRILLSNLLQSTNPAFLRDFKTLSIQHIGNIYEGLLEFDFKEVLDTTQHYVTYTGRGKEKEVDAQMDDYDFTTLKTDKSKTIISAKTYKKGEIYLSNTSNSRKTTASYYTPKDLTDFMVDEALKTALQAQPEILKLRILDNACGSGHFLFEVLNQITEIAYDQIIEDKHNEKDLSITFQTEKAVVLNNVKKYVGQNIEVAIDELVILKRLLLKKIIFGVDLNPFAVELTRLSLWLDTFIFGTPLSFIEHHIKQGNALIGSTIDEVRQTVKDQETALEFKNNLNKKLKKLTTQLKALSDLKDTTKEEILASKEIYKNLQEPLNTLNNILNLHTYKQFISLEFPGESKEVKEKRDEKLKQINTAFQGFELQLFKAKNKELIQEIETVAKKYRFFNYQIEFAEVFQNNQGFHCIIGNPPWDKTKFDDKDFFPQYLSSYRTLKQSEKDAVRKNILAYQYVGADYQLQKDTIEKTNEYYKLTYPYNAGAGDNNLFRFFMERNLLLLDKKGALNYLTPSSWIYEDSSVKLRKYILKKYDIAFFYQFENKKGIFPRVHRSYKFAMFQLQKVKKIPLLNEKNEIVKLPKKKFEEEIRSLPVRFMQTDTAILKTKNDIINYSYKDIALLSPKHFSLMEVKAEKDLEILRKIYQKFAPIDADFIDFRRELDATLDRDLFIETNAEGLLPLYEGKMMHQFNSKFGEAQYWVNKEKLQERLLSVEVSRLINDVFEQIPPDDKISYNGKGKQHIVLGYLGLETREELYPFVVYDTAYPRLVFRGIASNTNERTMISALIPVNTSYQHSMMGHIPKKYVLEIKPPLTSPLKEGDENTEVKTPLLPKEGLGVVANKTVTVVPVSLKRVLFVNAIFNSVVADYVFRFLVDINVSKIYLMQLPMPTSEQVEAAVYEKLVKNAFLLNWKNNKVGFEAEAKILGISEKEIPSTTKQIDMLKIDNDKMIMELYGINKDEITHILSEAYFKLFAEKHAGHVNALIS